MEILIILLIISCIILILLFVDAVNERKQRIKENAIRREILRAKLRVNNK